jgi:hypothetical protein
MAYIIIFVFVGSPKVQSMTTKDQEHQQKKNMETRRIGSVTDDIIAETLTLGPIRIIIRRQ